MDAVVGRRLVVRETRRKVRRIETNIGRNTTLLSAIWPWQDATARFRKKSGELL